MDKAPYAVDLIWKAIASEEESSAAVYTEASPLHISKVLTFYRDSAFEIDAKYANPEKVPDNDVLISKAVVSEQTNNAQDPILAYDRKCCCFELAHLLRTLQVEGVTAGADGKVQKVKVKVRMDDSGSYRPHPSFLVFVPYCLERFARLGFILFHR